MTKRARKPRIEPHQGAAEMRYAFGAAFHFANRMPEPTLQTSTGAAFTVEARESGGRRVIVFRQRGREYARAYECCWGHYYNCNRTRIGMYCTALDSAVKEWFERTVAELKAELEKLPAERQMQLKRELESEIEE